MEILAPAGSPEALFAAVYNGADAVYLGVENFNARKNAQNFSIENIGQYIDFCRQRGVKVHAVLNTLVSDRELPEVLSVAERLVGYGVDAFIVQDIGLACELRKRTDVPLHASTQLTVHSLDGAVFLRNMGFSRVVLSRELSAQDIGFITRRAQVETEVFVHGALCMSYSGQCALSAVIGGRSGNRGSCAQPCRLPYEGGYRLSLKDLCLLKYVGQLQQMGVHCLKIEGRMKGPDYVGAVCRAYAEAKNGKPYAEEDEQFLSEIFSRDGFTDKYFMGKPGPEMFGTRGKSTRRFSFEQKEYKRFDLDVQVTFSGENAHFFVQTSDGYSAEDMCSCSPAVTAPTGKEQIEAAFSKLGDTVYRLGQVSVSVPENPVFIPVSVLNAMRRGLIESLSRMRKLSGYTFKKISLTSELHDAKGLSVSKGETLKSAPTREALFLQLSSIPRQLKQIDRIWLPLSECENKQFRRQVETDPQRFGVFLPAAVHDSEAVILEKWLLLVQQMQIRAVLCSNVGQVEKCLQMGFEVHGGSGLNVFNTPSARFWTEEIGLKSVTLSFELNIAQAKGIECAQSGMLVYGRLPVMLMRNCIKKYCHQPEFLTDRQHQNFLITCDFGCRNRLWNSKRLYLADKQHPDFDRFSFLRWIFTDETPQQVQQVLDAYAHVPEEVPDDITRGLYYRKV